MAEPTNQILAEAFVFEDWLRDGLKGMRHEFEARMKCESPRQRFDASEFKQHMRNARREHLLAVRSLIDSAIERLDKKSSNG